MSILENIKDHDDLIQLNTAKKEALCQEIRDFLISSISQTGGHLASNLGVVELSVALETVFDTRVDRLVFDVGHQSYIHKLLTGRQADFSHLRQFGGIAGFPKPGESDTDAFVAGHASSSVSIALGMARARTLMGDKYRVISVLGDGAVTGGMAYEGLSDAADSKEPMVIILNDNEMSIDRNVGGMAKHLNRLRTKQRYLGMKSFYRGVLHKLPGGAFFYRLTHRIKNWFKRMVLPVTLFENMGLTYLGPVDGHDLSELIRILEVAQSLNQPVLVHVLTQKGHGYKFAQENPSKFHGIAPFDPETGKVKNPGKGSFSEAFGNTLCKLAQEDRRICAITAAMPGGTGLLNFKQQFPKRLFDVGIAEEHAVSMAGGLAKQGMIPVVALYSTFLQRSYDQILQDIALLGLHAVLAVDRAGLVGEDGETHHGTFDVGFLRHAPGMQILCPASCQELTEMLTWAVKECSGPVAVRYPRGGDRGYSESNWGSGNICCHRTGRDVTILTYGTMVSNALAAADILQEKGISASVIRILNLSDISARQLLAFISGPLIVLEEAAASCAVFWDLAAQLHSLQPDIKVFSHNLGSHFVTHGSLQQLYEAYGLDGAGIAEFAQEVICNEN